MLFKQRLIPESFDASFLIIVWIEFRLGPCRQYSDILVKPDFGVSSSPCLFHEGKLRVAEANKVKENRRQTITVLGVYAHNKLVRLSKQLFSILDHEEKDELREYPWLHLHSFRCCCFVLFCFLMHALLNPYGKFGPPFLGKATAAAWSTLPSPICVCDGLVLACTWVRQQQHQEQRHQLIPAVYVIF